MAKGINMVNLLSDADVMGSGNSSLLSDADVMGAKKQNKGIGGDLATSIKRGVEELPGIATGIADIIPAVVGGVRPFTKAAEYAGEKTGFQPGKWAEEAQQEYSPAYKQAQSDIDTAWKEQPALGIAGTYLKNPGYLANQVAESLPSMAVGGIAGRAAMTAGRVAVPAIAAGEEAAGVASKAAPSYLERAVGEKWAAPVAGGAGEGVIQSGQQMSEGEANEDQRKNAVAAISSGLLDAIIGGGAGRVAQKMGLETAETLMAKGLKHTGSEAETAAGRGVAANMAAGAASEGILQELPQSAQEQIWQNYAAGKPLLEGVERSAIEGALAGGVMGGAANIRSTKQSASESATAPQVGEGSATAEVGEALAQPEDSQPEISPSPKPIMTSDTVRSHAQSLIDAVDAGGIPTSSIKINTIARMMGMQVHPTDKPEVTIDRIRRTLAQQSAPYPDATPSTDPLKDAVNAAHPDTFHAQASAAQDSISAMRASVGSLNAIDNDAITKQLEIERAKLGLKRESDLESTDNRVAGAQAANTRQARLSALDSIYANPDERTPGMTFLEHLDKEYPNNPNPTPEEKSIIAKRESAHQAFIKRPQESAEIPSLANESDFGIKEPKMQQQELARNPDVQLAKVDEFMAKGYAPIIGGRALANKQGKKMYLSATQREYLKQKQGEQNALQEPSTSSLLPSAPEATGETGGEPERVGSSQQGAETASSSTAEPAAETGNRAEEVTQKQEELTNGTQAAETIKTKTQQQEQPAVKQPNSPSISRTENAKLDIFGHAPEAIKAAAKSLKLDVQVLTGTNGHSLVSIVSRKTGGSYQPFSVRQENAMRAALSGEKPTAKPRRTPEEVAADKLSAKSLREHRAAIRELADEYGIEHGVGRSMDDIERDVKAAIEHELGVAGRSYATVKADAIESGIPESVIDDATSEVEAKYAQDTAADAHVRMLAEMTDNIQGLINEKEINRGEEKGGRTEPDLPAREATQNTEQTAEEPQKLEALKAQARGEITGDQAEAINKLADAGEHAAVDEILKPKERVPKAAPGEAIEPKGIDKGTALYSQDFAPVANPHTVTSLQQSLIDAQSGRAKRAMQAMLDTGKAKVITAAHGEKIVGEKIGSDARAFFNPRDGVSYFIADNISKDTADLKGLALHEIAVHAMHIGKDNAEFKSILKQVDEMRKAGNKKVIAAFDRVPEGTRPRDITHEALAYLVQESPQLPIIKRVIAWMRNSIRAIAKSMPVMQGLRISEWAASLNDADLLYMAKSAFEGYKPQREPSGGAVMASKDTMYSRSAFAGLADGKWNKAEEVTVGESGRTRTPEQLASFKRLGRTTTTPSLKERYQELTSGLGKKLAQNLVDQFAPIKDLSQEAYRLMRLSKGSSGAFEVLLNGGRLKINDGVYDFDESKRGGVVQRLLQPLNGEHDDFMWWVAANRAELLSNSDREHLFTSDDIKAMKSLADGETKFDYTIQHGANKGKVTRNRLEIYRDSLATFNEFNKNAMDMAEQSGLIDPESRKLWESEFYVPFYRVSEESNDGVRGMNIKGGVVRQQAFKKLKGGAGKLNADLLENTLMNWAHLLDAAAKNRAAKASLDAAEEMGVAHKASASDKNTVWYMGEVTHAIPVGQEYTENGVTKTSDGTAKIKSIGKIEYAVDDPAVMVALQSLEYAGMNSPIMKAMGTFKHYLTIGVTASPFFKIRNLIRDSVQSIAIAPLDYNVAKNLKQGWKLTDPKSDEYFRLMAGGGMIHFGTMIEGSESKRVRALVEKGVDASTILDDESKIKQLYTRNIEPVVTAYNELGNRGEAINRATLYDQLTKQGMGHQEASFLARDMMDFSMAGSSTTIRFLTQVVPFMNARLQGLYKLGKAAHEDPKRMGAVLGAVAVASIGLMLAYKDDDDWKKREDWDRDSFWWFKLGGEAYRIPKPFEIGAIASLAERGIEYFATDEMTGERFTKRFFALLSDNLAMNPIPQVVKPIIDVYSNKDSFSGRPIETMGMEKLNPEYRFTQNTSMAARAASTAGNAATFGHFASPVQIDHMIRGYFGWLGSFVVGASEQVARPLSGQAEKPSSDMWKIATGGMISNLDEAQSRYVSQMYDQAKTVDEAYGTWRMLQKTGQREEAAKYQAEHADELKKYKNVDAVKNAESKLNERIKIIERSNLDPDIKREKINAINRQKDIAARRLN